MKEVTTYNRAFLATSSDKTQDSLEARITFYHLALFLVMLPFDRFFTHLIFLSVLAHTLIHFNKLKLRLVFTKQNLILGSVFFATLIGAAWSDDKAGAAKEVQRHTSIILFPIILSATSLDLQACKNRLLLIFGSTCTLIVVYLFTDAIRIILYYQLPLSSLLTRAFLNHNFSLPIGLNATYLSLYVALSLAAFFFFLTNEKNRLARFLYGTAILILLLGLIELASKAALLATTIIIAFGVVFYTTKKTSRARFLIVGLSGLILSIFFITRIDSLKKRFITGFRDDLAQTADYKEVSEPRMMRWQCAITLIKQSPIVGHGSGTERKLLKDQYFKKRLYNSYLHELNAHNQYLSFLIKTGIIGLAVFISTLSIGFRTAWRSHDFVFTSFMILISTVSLSENILDVNKGIFFFAFFLSLFTLSPKSHSSI